MNYTITKSYPLRANLKKHGLTVRAFAEQVGLHPTYVSRLLTGKCTASEAVAARIKAYFDARNA